MKVAFHLRRRSTIQGADALLLTTVDSGELLALCARLRLDPLARIHVVAGGFLLQLATPVSAMFPRTIRLRSLCDNLLLPADADLVPQLRQDEARGLVRDRGLVFLPGGRILSFNIHAPLAIQKILTAGPSRRRPWQALPSRPPLAERIRAIVLDLPQPPPEEILDAGSQDIGSEAPRPPDAGIFQTLKGKAALGLGKGLMGLGKALNLKGLANRGAEMVQKAVEMVPRLSESVLGRQEAALRELLREFREGNLERALRRALPLGGPGGRGGTPATNDHLPRHPLTYSLGNILGGSGRASIWFGGYDVQRELEQEYRKAAEQAVKQGDYRRAAFIYGRLLQDYRRAADTLFQGGLFHDAAILYLTQLDDRRQAARAFEAAGEIDRAVQLYRQLGEHAMAGDALQRAGEEEAALVEYRIAAEGFAGAGNYLGAGNLMLTRAGRPDLAVEYFEEGWRRRPETNAVPCAVKLALLYTEQQTMRPLLGLVSEGRVFFDPPGNVQGAGQFYDTVTSVSESPNLASVRDDLRDQALLGLSIKMRQRVGEESRAGDIVSTMLGRSGAWAAPLVSDAQFAVRAAIKRPQHSPRPRSTTRVHLGTAVVTAACAAPATGEVFVGFADGQVVCFRPLQNEVIPVPTGHRLPVASLAVDNCGAIVVAIFRRQDAHDLWSTYTKVGNSGRYQLMGHGSVEGRGNAWLAPIVVSEEDRLLTGLWDGEKFQVRNGVHLDPWGVPFTAGVDDLSTALLLPFNFFDVPGFRDRQHPSIHLFHWSHVKCFIARGDPQWRAQLAWTPDNPAGTGLLQTPLAWRSNDRDLELAGLEESGTLHWSRLQFSENSLRGVTTHAAKPEGGYRAVAILGPGSLVGVATNRIDWLRGGGKRFVVPSSVTLPRIEPVACFVSPATAELLIVCRDGGLERVTLPQ